MVAQFTAKTRNPEKAIYFLSLISCSINKLKSRTLFTCKNFLLSDFFFPGYGGCRGAGADADTRINTNCHNQRGISGNLYLPRSLILFFSYGHLWKLCKSSSLFKWFISIEHMTIAANMNRSLKVYCKWKYAVTSWCMYNTAKTVKSVHIGSFFGLYFSAFGLNTEIYYVFSQNDGG